MTGAGDSRRPGPRRRAEPIAVAVGGVRAPLGRARVADLARAVLKAEGVRRAEVSITFLADGDMAALNWRHLRHRGPTDIITFELPSPPGAPLVGDVYVAPDVVRAHAREHGCTAREELARVIVHGMLHVLGHEHPEDDARTGSPMWRRQERLLARLFAPAGGSAR